MSGRKYHIIDFTKFSKKITFCGKSAKIVRCRRRYGQCNLQDNHWPKTNHDAYAEMPSDMIEIADEDDSYSDVCEIA